ncbi:MAG: hypothetical protein JO056_02075 [Alphaproteobacteria bacterium]|nr:hypothetical protein [Alphaproteobacteria bacterium]
MRWLAIAALLCIIAKSAFAECYPESAAAAENATRDAKTWQALYAIHQRFGICDDGAVAKAFSVRVGELLTAQWSSVPDLAKMARRHPKFRTFVLRHIDSSLTAAQVQTIIHSTEGSCAVRQRSLCDAIAARARKAAAH